MADTYPDELEVPKCKKAKCQNDISRVYSGGALSKFCLEHRCSSLTAKGDRCNSEANKTRNGLCGTHGKHKIKR